MKVRQTVWLGLLLVLVSVSIHAQVASDVEPYEEFGKRLRAAQEVTPLKSDLFGDKLSLYNGASEFDLVDVDLPGNSSLPVQLRRRLVIEDRRKDPGNLAGLGDWDLDVPYIVGTFTQENGWVVRNGDNPDYARCSNQSIPYVKVSNITYTPDYAVVWDGNHVHIPGGADDELLKNTEAKLPAITDGNTYPWVTKSYYRFGCIGSTANGYPGEAFVAISPDGVRYTFNWVVVRTAPDLLVARVRTGTVPVVQRSRVFFLATRVEDRFGNWVTYTYGGSNGDQLTQIAANDGRVINITWSGNTVVSAVSAAGTWSYGYTNGALSSVTQPDGSQWSYTTVSGSMITVKTVDTTSGDYYPPNTHCQIEPVANTGDFVYTVGAPSGASGTFHFSYQRQYRNYVPFSCNDGNTYHLYPDVDNFFDGFSLVSRQITGAGLSTLTWNYDYGLTAGSYFTPSVPGPWDSSVETYITQGTCSGCSLGRTVTVTGPDDITKLTFGVQYARNEGRLLQTESDTPSGTVMKTVSNTYVGDDEIASQLFPDNAGQSILPTYKNPMVGRIRPTRSTTTVQDGGDTYTLLTEAFDAFAQPTVTKRSNTIPGQSSVEEQVSYLNDLTHWILGLHAQTDNLTTGETVSKDVYDPSSTTLSQRWRFGQLVKSYTFNAQGQLASFTDGNNYTTSLSNYYRGIPQSINYPDNTNHRLVVDDAGRIIRVTDQAGHTMSYGYDAMGRMTRIDYPAGDEVAWAPRIFAYDFVSGAERGIGGGHWRRTVTTGNNTEVTYFDAMLRPLLHDSSITGTAGSDITTANSYDWRGLTTFTSYPVSGAPALSAVTTGTHKTYDTLGRLTQSQQDSELGTLTTTTAYLSGAGVQVTDPKNNVTTTYAQVFDVPSYDAPIKVQAPAGITQIITRDLYGHPTAITQLGIYNGTESDSVTKTLTYDSYHRLCRTTEPESGSTVMAYDGANNLSYSASGLNITGTGCGQEQVAATAKTNFTYDPMNRVLTIAPPSGTQSTQYLYDALGNMYSATSGSAVWNGSYNYRGMLTGESLSLVGQNTLALGYAHDAYGSLSSIRYPNGENVNYAPDARGRPTQVGGYASQIGYFPNGAVASFTYGSGAGYVAEQSARLLFSNFSYGIGGTLNLSEDVVYDSNGNITNVNDLTSGQRSKQFQYDGLNRLTNAVAPALWGTESYTYDPLNNLRTRLSAGQTSVYNYDATNRLLNITRAGSTVNSFGYDNRGNLINKNGASLVFDQKDQLSQITGLDSYLYDANGRRVQKTPANGGAPTYYFYNRAGQLMYQYEPGAGKTTNFIYLGTKLVGDNESLVLVAPGAVSFDANPNNGSYTVSWGAVPAATAYTLQESVNGGGWVTVYTGSAASATLSGRTGGSYVYQVQGCNGAVCGGWTASATLGVRPALPTVTVPSGTINGTYTVSWTAPATATNYNVQESLNGGAWTTIASATVSTSIGRPGNVSGSYTYQVAANSAYGNRGWAASVAVTVDTTYGVLPAAPASLSVPASSNNGSATLSWGATSLTTRYVVEQSSNGGTNWTSIYNGTGTSTAVSGLADGSYLYHVQSCNTYGCSAWTAGSATLVVTHPPTTAPTISVPASNTNGSYTVSWSGVAGQVSYTLQEQLNGGGWTTVQTNGMTSWSTSGRGNGTYGYHVQACNVGGCGPWSAVASTSVLLPPPVPVSISVPATSNGPIAISWAASATATSYGLDQSVNGGAWAQVYANAATSTSVTAGASGSYSYRVYACNASGCNGYATSGAVTVTIPPASAPSLSVPASSTNGSYTISWGGVSGATSYTLQEQVNGGGWTTVQANGNTSWSTSGRGNGTYGYHVQACNAGGCGPWGAVASTTVLWVPPVPASISVPATSNGPIAISWASSATATSYGLDQSVNGGGWAQVYNGGATSTSISAGASGSYSYRVMACNASGCNGYATSSAVAVTIPPASAPSLSVPATSNTGSYTVSWGGVSGATSYTLQEQVNGGGWSTLQSSVAVSWGASGKGNGTYGYQAQACNAGGCGPWSGVGSITVALPPAAPASVTAPSYVHGVQYYVTWTASVTATSYNVQRNNLTYGGSSIVATTSGTSATIAAPGSSVDLQYAVQACNAAGCSGFTNAPNPTQTDPPGPIQ
ncbi:MULTISPECIES: hypothetical protein [unclassified Rhodanobacter]|uniref:hypothetical protein n=1 Tax=unclassified Rhodanobacter TaxID=2621553 RepID=UPI000A3FAA58|nr:MULTISPECIES: hypothetical protein [unclassified Rhodanobacter]